jgi:uncharacterized membrane protein
MRPLLRTVPEKIDDYASRLTAHLVLLWPAAYGVAIGASAFVWTHPWWRGALEQNKVPEVEAHGALLWTLGGLALVAAIHAWAIARLPRPRSLALPGVLAQLRHRLAFTLALPVVAALGGAGIEAAGATTVIGLAALAALAVATTTYRWTEGPLAPADPDANAGTSAARPIARAAAFVALAALIAAFVALMGALTLTNFKALRPHTIDLGLYDNILWHTAHGDLLGSSFLKGGHHNSAHFDPLLIAIAPIYALRPRADTLLVLQVVWESSTLVPLYLLARSKLGSPVYGLAFAAMYALHPAVHGATLYEFHSLTLVCPFLVWLVYFLERGWYRAYALMLVPTLLCREDVALVMSFVGLYAILRGGRDRVRLGWVTAAVCVAYFAFVKRFCMDSSDLLNSGPGSYGFAYYYADLIPNGNGARGLVESLLTNPAFVVRNVLTEAKFDYAAALLVPLALLPLAARPARTMLAYGAIFCLLASKPAVYSIAFQYSSVILPLAFPVAIIALEQVPRWRVVTAFGLDATKVRRALLAFALTASALVSWKLGALDAKHVFFAGFEPIAHDLNDAAAEQYAWVQEAVASIPPDASVAATQRLGPFVSNRRDAYDYTTSRPYDYLFIDEADLSYVEGYARAQRVTRGELELLGRHQTLALYRTVKAPPAEPK